MLALSMLGIRPVLVSIMGMPGAIATAAVTAARRSRSSRQPLTGWLATVATRGRPTIANAAPAANGLFRRSRPHAFIIPGHGRSNIADVVAS